MKALGHLNLPLRNEVSFPNTLTRSATTLSRSRERGNAFEAEEEK